MIISGDHSPSVEVAAMAASWRALTSAGAPITATAKDGDGARTSRIPRGDGWERPGSYTTDDKGPGSCRKGASACVGTACWCTLSQCLRTVPLNGDWYWIFQ